MEIYYFMSFLYRDFKWCNPIKGMLVLPKDMD